MKEYNDDCKFTFKDSPQYRGEFFRTICYKLAVFAITTKIMNDIQINKKQNQSLRYQLRTFRFAFQGISLFFKEELKAKIHLTAAVMAIVSGLILRISLSDWIAVSIAIGFVFTLEIVNTALEKVVDLVSPSHHKLAGHAKDLSAGAVLISALTAFTIGLIVYIPAIVRFIAQWKY